MSKLGHFRFYLLLVLIVAAAGCVLIRLFSLQVVNHNFYTALAQGQHELSAKLVPRRGEIFIQEKEGGWNPLAMNRNFQTVFLAPNEVKNQQEVTEKIAPLTGISQKDILEKLADSNDPYEPLKSKLDDETVVKIKNLNLAGVHLIDEDWRWYPQGPLAANVLGFVGLNGDQKSGQYGLEQYYESMLSGQNGFLKSSKDALGRWLMLGDYELEPAVDGASLYLTLDQNIQYVLEQKLKAVLEKWDASGGCGIIMDPKTGAIRAMASWPSFDPNAYGQTENIDYFMNSCVQKTYEPGSVFKPVTMAAGLDNGKVSPETTYVDTGLLQIGGSTIRNAADRSYGLSTMTTVLEKSINTGAVFVERSVGPEIFRNYVKSFGFDEATGIDLAGETQGNLKNIFQNKEINLATASFGQGISVTPLEMASAIGAIANGGKLMRPYVVAKTVTSDGQEKITEPQVIRQVISPSSAGRLTAMLVSTVRNGYDKIKINNYFIAGKTGTAQIAEGQGYSTTDTIHSFAGYAPAYDPQFLIFLKMDKPRGINFASDSLAPTFAELAQYIFDYYEIPPEK